MSENHKGPPTKYPGKLRANPKTIALTQVGLNCLTWLMANRQLSLPDVVEDLVRSEYKALTGRPPEDAPKAGTRSAGRPVRRRSGAGKGIGARNGAAAP